MKIEGYHLPSKNYYGNNIEKKVSENKSNDNLYKEAKKSNKLEQAYGKKAKGLRLNLTA